MVQANRRVVRDPVYGYISLPDHLIRLVDHPMVQRLRRISQTSLASSVYPSMTGTRFEHAIGSMHIAGMAWSAAWQNSQQTQAAFRRAIEEDIPLRLRRDVLFDELMRDAVSAVALLHDVGHTPFSHALEGFYEHETSGLLRDPLVAGEYEEAVHRRGTRFHEFAGSHLTRELARVLQPTHLRELVIRIYDADGGESWAGAIKALIAGEIDVDRVDYLMRDAQRAGTEYGAIDYIRLIDALEIHEIDSGFIIAPGVRARPAAENLLTQRSLAYQWIYFHPRVVATDLCVLRAVEALWELSRSEERVRAGEYTISVGSAFRAIRPNLDYLSPPSSLQESLPGSVGDGVLADESVVGPERLLAELPSAGEPRALVDDSTVIEWLKAGCAWAHALLAQPVEADFEFRLRRFLAYYEAAMLREKTYWPCWKSYEEYGAVASDLQDARSFRTALQDSFRQLQRDPELSNRAGARALLDREGESVLGRLSEADADPVPVLNQVAGRIWQQNNNAIGDFLNLVSPPPPLERERGFWDATFKSYSSVPSEDQMEVVFRGDEPLSLRGTSRRAGAVARDEERGLKLFVFFFRAVPHTSTASVSNSEVREALRGVFVEHFPRLVRELYPRALKEYIMARTETAQPGVLNPG